MGQKKKKRCRGHFCWSCQRILANERFSGKGHARHLCRQCSKLGKEQLAFRQNVRNIDRCLTWEGFIRRKKRRHFERFLNHDDERTRLYAQRVAQEVEEMRREVEARRRREIEIEEAYADWAESSDFRDENESDGSCGFSFDDEIPY